MPRLIIMRDFFPKQNWRTSEVENAASRLYTNVDIEEPEREPGNLHTINLTAVSTEMHAWPLKLRGFQWKKKQLLWRKNLGHFEIQKMFSRAYRRL